MSVHWCVATTGSCFPASCGEPLAAVGRQDQQSERAGCRAGVSEDTLTPTITCWSLTASKHYGLQAG